MASKNKDEDEAPVNASLDGLDGEGAEGEGEKKGGMDAKKIILFVVAPLLILGGVGAGLYFTGTLDTLLGGGAKEEEHAEAKDDHGKEKPKAKKDDHGGGHGDGHGEEGAAGATNFLKIPDIIVNLNTPDGQPRYLRLSVQLEMKDSADIAAVEAVMPRVVDQFQTYLRELRVKDLRGTAGIYRLQIELLARVNAAAYPVEVKDVLFQEILIQ